VSRRAPRLPQFRWEARVEFWRETGWDKRATCVLVVTGNCETSDYCYSSAAWNARYQIKEAGVPAEVADNGHFEVIDTEFFALHAKYVRNPEGTPVQAFRDSGYGDPERELHIRQRRLVPQDIDEARAWYAPPKPAMAEPANEPAEAAA